MILIGNIGYFFATTLFLMGMSFMGKPKRASKGNTLLIIGMVIAVISTVVININNPSHIPWKSIVLITGLLLLGSVVGRKISFSFKITRMPELVSLFNGLGGLCAALISIVGLFNGGIGLEISSKILLLSGVFLGFVTFSGSLIAYLKLSGRFKVSFTYNNAYTWLTLIFSLLFLFSCTIEEASFEFTIMLILLSFLSTIHGLFFAIGVGSGDMPVLISVLNGLTGILTAVSGIYFENTIMILLGIFVGATGLILTLQMSRAMNKPLGKVFYKKNVKKSNNSQQADLDLEINAISASNIASDLTYTKKIVIVPGYGLAIAQAQKACAELKALLNNYNTEVKFVIHPVAGRMPGHMNVLLAEANIPYDDILDLETGNQYLAESDLCFVIGANDVVNISAENNENSPIYGMPIVQTYKSKKVVVIKRGLSNGYADIQNPIFGEENCYMFFTDAKKGLEEIVSALKMR